MGDGPNDVGSSRYHLIRAVDAQPAPARHRLHRSLSAARLRRRRRRSRKSSARSTTSCAPGKIRYIGCSNFSGWHLMKSLAVSEKYGCARYVAHQAYYSLVGRDYEWELMPLAHRSADRHRRVEPARLGPPDRQDPPRAADARDEPPAARRSWSTRDRRSTRTYLYRVVDALDEVVAGDRKDVAAGRAELAAQAADGVDRHHRRAQRGAARAESRRGRTGRSHRSRSRSSTPPAPRRSPIRTGISATSRSAIHHRCKWEKGSGRFLRKT